MNLQKRKALDKHLNFLVGEADKLSTILHERLNTTNNDSEVRRKELDNIAEAALEFQPKGYTLETTQVIKKLNQKKMRYRLKRRYHF